MNIQNESLCPHCAGKSRYPRIDAVVALAHLSQQQIADLLGIPQPDVSAILRYTETPRQRFAVRPERVARGEQCGNSRLTEDQVRAIRADTRTYRAIAADYAIVPSAIHQIKTRKTWRHVD